MAAWSSPQKPWPSLSNHRRERPFRSKSQQILWWLHGLRVYLCSRQIAIVTGPFHLCSKQHIPTECDQTSSGWDAHTVETHQVLKKYVTINQPHSIFQTNIFPCKAKQLNSNHVVAVRFIFKSFSRPANLGDNLKTRESIIILWCLFEYLDTLKRTALRIPSN